MVGSGLGECHRQVHELAGVPVGRELHRHRDIGGVPPNIGAVPVEYAHFVAQRVGFASREVPLVCPLGGDAEGPLLPGPANDDRRTGPLHRFGLTAGAPECMEGTLEIGHLVGEERVEDGTGLFEAIEALLPGGKGYVVGPVLILDPTRAESDLEAAVRGNIERGRHVGEHGGVPVGVAGDQHPEPDPVHDSAERRQHRPSFEHRAGAVTEDGVEMVERPPGVERLDPVGLTPEVDDRTPLTVLGSCLEGKPHGCSFSRRIRARAARTEPGSSCGRRTVLDG